MVNALLNFWISFLAGLSAPLVAVCVIPLYPGFLAYFSSQLSTKWRNNKNGIILLGIISALGVIVSMLIIGLIFTGFLQSSLTNAIAIISPIAFIILLIVSILLIFNLDFSRHLPMASIPLVKNPLISAFVFGFFFGAITLPCNPAPLIVLFAISSSVSNFITNLLNFILFGIGMALPLLIFSLISAQWSEQVIGFLTKRKRAINLISGLLMLAISIYYLVFVFNVF